MCEFIKSQFGIKKTPNNEGFFLIKFTNSIEHFSNFILLGDK
jgi:hypothetical protein